MKVFVDGSTLAWRCMLFLNFKKWLYELAWFDIVQWEPLDDLERCTLKAHDVVHVLDRPH
jgi:hypothetical protein